jgi:hypothetical protein
MLQPKTLRVVQPGAGLAWDEEDLDTELKKFLSEADEIEKSLGERGELSDGEGDFLEESCDDEGNTLGVHLSVELHKLS